MAKIDIEGAEQDLFSDNIEWITLTPLLIVELHDWLLPKGRTSRPFLECISKLDRDFVSIAQDIENESAIALRTVRDENLVIGDL